jgi:Holliday junction resolvase RusA-like endonuclease
MVNELKLISPIPVSVNHYIKARGFITWKGKTPIANVSMYETKEAKDYKKQFKKYVTEQAAIQNYSLTPTKTQHFYVDCVFYFERTDQDPNNYFKLPLDAITETQLIWLDDNTTCERVQAIYYDSDNPRIEITIKPVDYIGIFDTVNHLNEFKEKCRTCARNKRNCSIFNKAIEGRIQEEISEGACKKYRGIIK